MSRRWELLEHILGQARTVQALATVAIAVALGAPMIVQLSGWAGLAGVLAPLLLLSIGSLWSLRLELETRYLSITLLVLVGWCCASIAWSRYPLEALGGALLLLGFGVLGAFVALTRDMSQIVRSFGRVLRWVLLGSFGIELFAGIILDGPIPALGIHGNLTPGQLGPIQGLMGTTDLMAFVAVVAAVTFVIETRMGALRWYEGAAWIAGSLGMVLLTRSAVGIAVAAVGAIAVVAMEAVTRAKPERRRSRQIAVVLLVGVLGTIVWAARWPIVTMLNGATEALYRYDLWQQVLALYRLGNTLFGRGYLGRWNLDTAPYSEFRQVQSRQPVDAASAYIDALFQIGAVGLTLLILALGAALLRSWLYASRKRSVVHQWPALVLAVLAASGFAMSAMLYEAGWMLLVICAVKASHQVSWRRALGTRAPPPLAS